DPEDTIIPRLAAAGANLNRVRIFEEVLYQPDRKKGLCPRAPMFPDDAAALEETIREAEATFVVIDPLMAFLNRDSASDQQVRQALHPLKDVAAGTRATIIIVRHLNKKPGLEALYRGSGSIGITAQARAAFIVAADPVYPGARVLAPAKQN